MPTGGRKVEDLSLEAGADGNGCDRREVGDWRSRVLEQADWEANWKSVSVGMVN